MPSIFTRIIQGEIPCHKVGEDERFLAFLDINPLRDGHTLVIPKLEVDRFLELPDELLAGILPFAREVGDRIRRVVPCDRIGLCVIGLEVPHAHLHLVPIDRMADMDFTRPKLQRTQDELADLARRIRQA
ncbi:MAG: HIT family protein [Flavobacteriales bacterium]|nr:putative HIT-like protein [Flavobacteriales bacterium]MCC6577788.1 HIT family protein [Flavobacteriales bacterium]NUQ15474.1 HIT family protein [Flavobacteriales bacterium]